MEKTTESRSPNLELTNNYKYLITFPKSNTFIVLFGIISYVILPVSYLIRNGASSFQITILTFYTIPVSIITLFIINLILKKKSTIASIRRISISSIIINLIGSGLFNTIGSFFPSNELISLYVLILFLQFSINLLFITSLFSNGFIRDLVVTFLTVIPSLTILVASTSVPSGYRFLVVIINGLIMICIILIMLYKIDTILTKKYDISTLAIFRSFLKSWINGDNKDLEDFLMTNSEKKDTITWLIHIETESGKKLAIVIPYVHPGPFYPIGSYNLVQELSDLFTSRKYNYCFVLHGPVDHIFNLSSRQSVLDYILQINTDIEQINLKYPRIGIPEIKVINEIRMVVLQVDEKQVIFLSSNNAGLEDYPPELLLKLTSLGAINKLILIDSHNSLGPTPQKSIIDEIIHAINQIKKSDKVTDNTKVAFMKIKKEDLGNNEDLGSNGIGILLMQIEGLLYALINIDANNSIPEIREVLAKTLQNYEINLIDVTTSDTHFNATKVRNSRGYFLFGERTPREPFIKTVTEACLNLRNSLEPFMVAIKLWNNKVDTIKPSVYSDLRDTVRTSIRFFKYGILVLSFIFVTGVLLIWVL